MKILLVEPSFPIPSKSKNHKNFLPIGLLKLYSYFKANGHAPKLVRGNLSRGKLGTKFCPEEIYVTSLFTYWSQYVVDSVNHYRSIFPDAKIVVGGIYASLMYGDCRERTGADEVHIGLIEEAEKYPPAYDILPTNPHPLDYQILHASRGCIRRCEFCGTWKIEDKFTCEKTIKEKIVSRKLIFYDNNLLANPHIEDILTEIIELGYYRGKPIVCESQSGFDGRILQEKPHIGKLLKKSRFMNPRIAWDNSLDDWRTIKDQINILKRAGYNSKDIYIFMIYNHKHSFEEMESKRIKCWSWKVQIADCRYRPLDQKYDHYNPRKKGQTTDHYYIHEPLWTDALVKKFRQNVRRQNICVRQGLNFYSRAFERKEIPREKMQKLRNEKKQTAKKEVPDAWFPEKISSPLPSAS